MYTRGLESHREGEGTNPLTSEADRQSRVGEGLRAESEWRRENAWREGVGEDQARRGTTSCWDEDDADVGCAGSIRVAGTSVAERECSTSEWPVHISTQLKGIEKNLERGIQYGGENRIEERGRTLTKARDLVFTGPHAHARAWSVYKGRGQSTSL